MKVINLLRALVSKPEEFLEPANDLIKELDNDLRLKPLHLDDKNFPVILSKLVKVKDQMTGLAELHILPEDKFTEIYAIDSNLKSLQSALGSKLRKLPELDNQIYTINKIIAYISALRSLLPVLFNYYISNETRPDEIPFQLGRNTIRMIYDYRNCIKEHKENYPYKELEELSKQVEKNLWTNVDFLKGDFLKAVFRALLSQNAICSTFTVFKPFIGGSANYLDRFSFNEHTAGNRCNLTFTDPDFKAEMKLHAKINIVNDYKFNFRYLGFFTIESWPHILFTQQDSINQENMTLLKKYIKEYPTKIKILVYGILDYEKYNQESRLVLDVALECKIPYFEIFGEENWSQLFQYVAALTINEALLEPKVVMNPQNRLHQLLKNHALMSCTRGNNLGNIPGVLRLILDYVGENLSQPIIPQAPRERSENKQGQAVIPVTPQAAARFMSPSSNKQKGEPKKSSASPGLSHS